jgi:hypothetical protein
MYITIAQLVTYKFDHTFTVSPPIHETEAIHRYDSSTHPFHIMYRFNTSTIFGYSLLVLGLLSLGLMLERNIEIKIVLGQKLCNISRQFISLLLNVCVQ